MTVSPRVLIALVAAVPLAFAGGYGTGRYAAPAKTLTITKTEWRERLIEHKVEGPVRVVTVTVTRPPPEKPPPPGCPQCPPLQETTSTEERGPVTTDARAENVSTSSESTSSTHETPRLTLGLGAGVPLAWPPAGPGLAGMASYRFAGPLSVWAAGDRHELLGGLALTF